jgi:hypothetical protein
MSKATDAGEDYHVELFSKLTQSTFLLTTAKSREEARRRGWRLLRFYGLWLFVKAVYTQAEYEQLIKKQKEQFQKKIRG